MIKKYDHRKIEKKWQAIWEKKKVYRAKVGSSPKKFYGLIEFPYPSGSGLHVGHIRSNTAMDIIARKRRMQGFNVLYPIGWDAFGLPTENYAIKSGIHPIKVTKQNTDTFRKQLKSLGFSFDWSREINTTDPKYYKWTQWIFLQLFKKGLAYKKKTSINWCPSCKIGLANEEVVGGSCERCGGRTEKREKEQWMLAITKYADRLDKDLDTVDFLEKIKIQQRNWIGRSEGMLFSAPVKDTDLELQTFSAHFESFMADTFVVIAPDHPMLEDLVHGTSTRAEVLAFAREMVEDRLATGYENKELKGIFTGRYIKDPVGNGDLPIWVSSFALSDYGTGIVKCSAHDERDFAFAKKYNIRLKPVLFPADPVLRGKVENLEICYTDMQNGILSEPQFFTGAISGKVRSKIIEYLEKNNLAKRSTNYKLRDWVFSRQRYWGEPIPLVHCGKCGWVPVPEKYLPIVLPKVAKYKPRDDGESPLAGIKSWVNVKCPKCRAPARRETDTMPNWAGSSWYFLRYADPKNNRAFASKKNLNYWVKNGVDWYNGGMEHTTLHLLYSRFWHKFLFDLKLVPSSEPFMKRTSHGLILAGGGEKMSKSKGNVVNPDELVKVYGADTIRLYEMFMGPFDQAVSWSTDSMIGPRRFLEKVWRVGQHLQSVREKNSPERCVELLHKTAQKVSEDIEAMRFNTAISAMMIFINQMESVQIAGGVLAQDTFETFLKILFPFAPHIAEELWQGLSHHTLLSKEKWPEADLRRIKATEVKIIVQINGKLRGEVSLAPDQDEEAVKEAVLRNATVLKHLANKSIKRIVYVKNKLMNIVV